MVQRRVGQLEAAVLNLDDVLPWLQWNIALVKLVGAAHDGIEQHLLYRRGR